MIALPFFASLGRPRPAHGAAAAAKRRFVGFYLPCGIVMSNWTPATEGAGWSSPILAPLAPYASHTLVLSGVNNVPGRSDGGGDHAAGTGAFLTATHVRKTANADILNGISVDQVAANALAEQTHIASMQLGIDGGAGVGDCDSGYSCVYSSTMAWKGSPVLGDVSVGSNARRKLSSPSSFSISSSSPPIRCACEKRSTPSCSSAT